MWFWCDNNSNFLVLAFAITISSQSPFLPLSPILLNTFSIHVYDNSRPLTTFTPFQIADPLNKVDVFHSAERTQPKWLMPDENEGNRMTFWKAPYYLIEIFSNILPIEITFQVLCRYQKETENEKKAESWREKKKRTKRRSNQRPVKTNEIGSRFALKISHVIYYICICEFGEGTK